MYVVVMDKLPLAPTTLLARIPTLSKVGGAELSTLPLLWVITRQNDLLPESRERELVIQILIVKRLFNK